MADPETIAKAHTILAGLPSNPIPVTLLDVDQESRDSWHAPIKVPHSVLARLIELVKTKEPSSIILDFDLSSDDPEELPDFTLAELLKNYGDEDPVLMLARRMAIGSTEEGNVEVKRAYTTPYDQYVAEKPNIQWITTLNDVEHDKTVRRIRLWQSICTDTEEQVYPSAVLVAGAVSAGVSAGLERLEEAQKIILERECGNGEHQWPNWLNATSPIVSLPYVITAHRNERHQLELRKDNLSIFAFQRVSARVLIPDGESALATTVPIDSSPFKNRAVVIGATDIGSGDVYPTPAGVMPGALILANGVLQSSILLENSGMPAWLHIGVTMGTLIVAFILIRRFHSLIASALVFVVSTTVIFATSRNFGVYSGVSVVGSALLGLSFYGLIDGVVDYIALTRKRGWRAVFKEKEDEM